MPRLLILLLLASTALPATAQVGAAEARAFIEVSDLERATIEFADQLRQLIAMQAGQFPEPAAGVFEEAMGQALADDVLIARLGDFVRRHAHPDSLTAAIAWRRSDAVDPMMTQIEAAADDPQAQVSIQLYAMTGRFGRHEIAPEREEMARRYTELTGTADAMAELMLDLVVVSSQLSVGLLGLDAPPPEVLRESLKGSVGEEAVAPMMGTWLYAFRDKDDGALEAFLLAADNDESRYYTRLSAASMSHAVVGALGEAGAALIPRLERLHEEEEFDFPAWRAQTRAQMGLPGPSPD